MSGMWVCVSEKTAEEVTGDEGALPTWGHSYLRYFSPWQHALSIKKKKIMPAKDTFQLDFDGNFFFVVIKHLKHQGLDQDSKEKFSATQEITHSKISKTQDSETPH